MKFQKGNKLAAGRGVLRRDPTIELITQLNELCKTYDGSKANRTKLNRMISNLIAKATDGDDVVVDGKLIKEGTGDLNAILAIIDRIEGRPAQKIVGPNNGPVQVEYRTLGQYRSGTAT
jgi:hypothetical protein